MITGRGRVVNRKPDAYIRGMRGKSPVDALVISYLTLRTIIGMLGIALPIVVWAGGRLIFGTGLQDSLSGYYYTGMRDVFVGALWAIGFFLVSYKGYSPVDDAATTLGGLLAVGISLFPTTPADPSATARVIGVFHAAFAGLFFLTLIYISAFLFTKTDPRKKPARRKLQRNVLYRICAIVMAGCIVLLALYTFIPGARRLASLDPVFWLESVAIVAFGVSWVVKGGFILKDR